MLLAMRKDTSLVLLSCVLDLLRQHPESSAVKLSNIIYQDLLTCRRRLLLLLLLGERFAEGLVSGQSKD